MFIADSLEDACRGAELIVTCTPARVPFLDLGLVAAGSLVVALGADHPEKSELDPMGLRLAPIHYAGGEVVYLPWAEEARALQFIQRVGPDYIVLHDGEVNQVPYGSKWFTEGISATCAEPVALPAGAERHRVWRWTCKQ